MHFGEFIQLFARAARRPGRTVRLLAPILQAAARAERVNYHAIHLAPAVTPRGGKPDAAVQSIKLADIPFPTIDLTRISDLISAIMTAPEAQQAVQVLLSDPVSKRSLMSTWSHIVIYSLIRNQRPLHVFEIGAYRGGTSEVIARALLANGIGTLHTLGPYDEPYFAPAYANWNSELKRVVRFYPVDSMAFFMRMEAEEIQPGLVLVDGNHDYEFASFDIHSAARRLQPGGFMVVDNIAQAGPFLAVQDFLEKHPGWTECGVRERQWDRMKSFDRDRSIIPDTDIAILRAPWHYLIDGRPTTFGEKLVESPEIKGLTLNFAEPPGPGQLSVECVLRGFGPDQIIEVETGVSVDMHPGQPAQTPMTIVFDRPLSIEAGLPRYSAEPWFVWSGERALQLVAPPALF